VAVVVIALVVLGFVAVTVVAAVVVLTCCAVLVVVVEVKLPQDDRRTAVTIKQLNTEMITLFFNTYSFFIIDPGV